MLQRLFRKLFWYLWRFPKFCEWFCWRPDIANEKICNKEFENKKESFPILNVLNPRRESFDWRWVLFVVLFVSCVLTPPRDYTCLPLFKSVLDSLTPPTKWHRLPRVRISPHWHWVWTLKKAKNLHRANAIKTKKFWIMTSAKSGQNLQTQNDLTGWVTKHFYTHTHTSYKNETQSHRIITTEWRRIGITS